MTSELQSQHDKSLSKKTEVVDGIRNQDNLLTKQDNSALQKGNDNSEAQSFDNNNSKSLTYESSNQDSRENEELEVYPVAKFENKPITKQLDNCREETETKLENNPIPNYELTSVTNPELFDRNEVIIKKSQPFTDDERESKGSQEPFICAECGHVVPPKPQRCKECGQTIPPKPELCNACGQVLPAKWPYYDNRHSPYGNVYGMHDEWSCESSTCRASTSRKLYNGESDDYSYCSKCSCESDDDYYPYYREKPCTIADSDTLLRRSKWRAFKRYFQRMNISRDGFKSKRQSRAPKGDNCKNEEQSDNEVIQNMVLHEIKMKLRPIYSE